MATKPGKRNQRWAVEVSNVLVAMTQSRLALRRAARRVEDRRLSQRLMRLARRKRSSAGALRRTVDKGFVRSNTDPEALFSSELASATEIGSVAACLRLNRRLRSTVDRAIDSGPPTSIRTRLESIRPELVREASTLTARLNEMIVQSVVVEATHADSAGPPTASAPVDAEAGPVAERVTKISIIVFHFFKHLCFKQKL